MAVDEVGRSECYRCSYALDGLTRPGHCPECGAEQSDAEYSKVLRQRRRVDRTLLIVMFVTGLGAGPSLLIAPKSPGSALEVWMLGWGLAAMASASVYFYRLLGRGPGGAWAGPSGILVGMFVAALLLGCSVVVTVLGGLLFL